VMKIRESDKAVETDSWTIAGTWNPWIGSREKPTSLPSFRQVEGEPRPICAARDRLLARSGTTNSVGVHNVHTLGFGLGRTGTGLAWIGDVFGSSQCFQGLECSSSPTSGTAFPLVRGGFALMCVH
jgi:hypothetical protein